MSRAPTISEMTVSDVPPATAMESERSVLGSMLSDPEDTMDRAEDRLQATDFFSSAHQILFAALLEMRNLGSPVDVVTAHQYLADRNQVAAAGGDGIFGELLAANRGISVYEHHVEIVRAKSLLRQLQQAASRTLYETTTEAHDIEAVITRAEAAVQRVSDALVGSSREQTVRSSRECAETFIRNAEALSGKKNQYNGIPTGFYQMDLLLKGFQPGEVIAIAAEPGLGKTAFMLNLVLNMARERRDPDTGAKVFPGHRVGIFSIEMNHLQLTNRMMSMMAAMPSGHVRTPQAWTQQDLDRMCITAENYAGLPITVDADGYMTPEKFRARARWMKKSKGVEIIFVDYLQLMNLSGKVNGDYEIELTRQASEAIRQTAKELNIPIVELLQFNKGGIRGGRPTMADIRGSGKIIQDAHYILIMHPVPEDDRSEGETMPIQITIDKARESERGVFRRFDYKGNIYTFKEQQSNGTSGRDAYV